MLMLVLFKSHHCGVNAYISLSALVIFVKAEIEECLEGIWHKNDAYSVLKFL